MLVNICWRLWTKSLVKFEALYHFARLNKVSVPLRRGQGLCGVRRWWMLWLLSRAVLPSTLLMDARLCCIVRFFCPLCCANMDRPIGYGWQGTVWADRCLGKSCWAGLVLTGGLGWMDLCSRASRGGGPKSKLEPGSETVMRATMCQDWQSSHTTRYPVNTHVSSPPCFFCISDTPHPSTKFPFPPFQLTPQQWQHAFLHPPFIFTLTGQTVLLHPKVKWRMHDTPLVMESERFKNLFPGSVRMKGSTDARVVW